MAPNSPLTGNGINQRSDLEAAMMQFLRGSLMGVDGMLPAMVMEFDRDKNIAKVQILSQVVTNSGVGNTRKLLINIPCISFGCGTFHVSFPLKKGSLGWILAADRDITEFLRTLSEFKPKSSRIKTFSDGLFFPDVLRNYVIGGEDVDAMVIQSTDGKTKISIRKQDIKIAAPIKVVVDTPDSEFTGNVSIAKKLTVNGASELKGTLKVTGAATLAGATVNGTQVDKHTHTNPEGGDVGPMK